MRNDPRLKDLSPDQKRKLLQAALEARRASGAPDRVEAPRTARWLTPLAVRPAARFRLVCFPHAAAGPGSFRSWPDLLPPEVEPLALCLPGRGERGDEPAAVELDAILEGVIRELANGDQRPIVLYGHSLGGAMAFAVANAMKVRGMPAPRLVAIAAMAPPGVATSELTTTAEDVWITDRILSNPQLSAQLRDRAEADRTLLLAWKSRSHDSIEAPVLAISARDDRWLTSDKMVQWAAMTRGGFEFRTAPGPHLFHLETPEIAIEYLCDSLGVAPARSGIGIDVRRAAAAPKRDLGFSLFFFSAEETEGTEKYKLFDAAVRFADRAGFEAVWLPERHFHPVGGLFPNPSVLGAALAAGTRRIRIRSGSVVLPLHDPLRVAEEWSVVDNLSGGRVDLGVVPGWNPNDFVLAPELYENRWAAVFDRLEIVRRLWRGDSIVRVNGRGEHISVRLHPRPLQAELPVWIATSANDESFRRAGELGLNIITALLIQSVNDFGRRVRMYREARAAAGHDPAHGRVTLMVHTCVGESDAAVRRIVREPFLNYMRTVQSLWKETVEALRTETKVSQEALEDMVFERYFHRSTLFGSLETCLRRAREFRDAGADEIACMIDFGVPYQQTMTALGWLDRLRVLLSDDGIRNGL